MIVGMSIVSRSNSQPKPNPSSNLIVYLHRVAKTQRATRTQVHFEQHSDHPLFVDVNRACIRICDFTVNCIKYINECMSESFTTCLFQRILRLTA